MVLSKIFSILFLILVCALPRFLNAEPFDEHDSAPSFDEALGRAFCYRPDAQELNRRFAAALRDVCHLTSVDSEKCEPELSILLCFPFPFYAQLAASAHSYEDLYTLLKERGTLLRSIQVQVTGAWAKVEKLEEDESAAVAVIRQAEEEARDSIERTRMFVAQPYEMERTQIALAQAKANLDNIRRQLAQARNSLQSAIGITTAK